MIGFLIVQGYPNRADNESKTARKSNAIHLGRIAMKGQKKAALRSKMIKDTNQFLNKSLPSTFKPSSTNPARRK